MKHGFRNPPPLFASPHPQALKVLLKSPLRVWLMMEKCALPAEQKAEGKNTSRKAD